MQTTLVKKTLFLFLLPLLINYNGVAQAVHRHLYTADSLFTHKQYRRALPVYEEILQHTGEASPAMLLRMAFIAEGTGDFTKALYYLNLYYLHKPRQIVILKMKDMAARYNLQGYEFRDIDFFIIYYDRYYEYLAAGLLIVCVWLLFTVLWRRKKGKFSPVRHGGTYLAFLLIALLLLNFRFNARKAIVARDNVYLMNAPSAGAQLVRIVQKGNRLDIYSNQDIWLETEWNGRPAYVRQQNVLLIK